MLAVLLWLLQQRMAIYLHWPPCFFPFILAITIFEGDLPLGDSFLYRLPPLTYSTIHPLLINSSMESFSWMQSSMGWMWLLWKQKYFLFGYPRCLFDGVMRSKRVVPQKIVLQEPTLNTFMISCYLNRDLCESVYIWLQTFSRLSANTYFDDQKKLQIAKVDEWMWIYGNHRKQKSIPTDSVIIPLWNQRWEVKQQWWQIVASNVVE